MYAVIILAELLWEGAFKGRLSRENLWNKFAAGPFPVRGVPKKLLTC
jgi:hypothetical protein